MKLKDGDLRRKLSDQQIAELRSEYSRLLALCVPRNEGEHAPLSRAGILRQLAKQYGVTAFCISTHLPLAKCGVFDKIAANLERGHIRFIAVHGDAALIKELRRWHPVTVNRARIEARKRETSFEALRS